MKYIWWEVILLSVSIAFGLTLTSDTTEKIKVPLALRGEFCTSAGFCTEIVWGHAKVYDRQGSGYDMEIFIVDTPRKVYRSSTALNQYSLEKNLVGARGLLSEVLPDGTEINQRTNIRTREGVQDISFLPGAGTYDLAYSGIGPWSDTIFDSLHPNSYQEIKLRLGGQTYVLRQVLSVAKEVEWKPGK